MISSHGKLPVAFESHQLVTVGRMVAEGLGVSAVPQLCRQQMEELGARCLPLSEPQVSRRVGLLHQAGHQLSSAAQALSETLLHQVTAPTDKTRLEGESLASQTR